MWSDAGLVVPGCPLCRVAREAERRSLDWFLIEQYWSLPMLVTLERDRFCRWHAAALLADERGARLSATFQFLAQAELELLQAFQQRLAREGLAAFARSQPSAPCRLGHRSRGRPSGAWPARPAGSR